MASVDSANCATCEVHAEVQLTYDGGASTCPEDMYGDSDSGTYEVDLLTDGTSNWYFLASGNQFGAGYWNEAGMNFLTDRTCVWF